MVKPINPLGRLFGRSPFKPLVSHMDKVWECTERLQDLFKAFVHGNHVEVERLSDEISRLEHAADLTKNDIRNNLPKGLFLPIDRGNLLEILALQDAIADEAEDVGIVLSYKNLEFIPELKEDFESFVAKNIQAVRIAHAVVTEMDNLLESSFGGTEANKIQKMVDEVAFHEHEVDMIQRRLLKKLFALEDRISHGSFILWLRLFNETASLSDVSEKLANRVRMTLETR